MVKRNVQLEQEAYELMMADLKKRDNAQLEAALRESASKFYFLFILYDLI